MRFFKKFVLIVLLLLAVDAALGVVLEKILQRQHTGAFHDLNYMLFEAKPGFVILGSSRASHHYDPVIFDSLLHKQTLNYGSDGGNVFNSFITLREIFKHHIPDIVLLDVKPDDFVALPVPDDIAGFYPFLKRMKLPREDFDMVSQYEQYKVMINAYRYNNLLPSLIGGLKTSRNIDNEITGFLPLPNIVNSFEKDELSFPGFEPGNFEYLKKIVALCISHKVKLIVCASPYYGDIHQSTSIERTQSLCVEKKVPFYNYLNDAIIKCDKKLFKDPRHLNMRGAHLFTNDIAEKISN